MWKVSIRQKESLQAELSGLGPSPQLSADRQLPAVLSDAGKSFTTSVGSGLNDAAGTAGDTLGQRAGAAIKAAVSNSNVTVNAKVAGGADTGNSAAASGPGK